MSRKLPISLLAGALAGLLAPRTGEAQCPPEAVVCISGGYEGSGGNYDDPWFEFGTPEEPFRPLADYSPGARDGSDIAREATLSSAFPGPLTPLPLSIAEGMQYGFELDPAQWGDAAAAEDWYTDAVDLVGSPVCEAADCAPASPPPPGTVARPYTTVQREPTVSDHQREGARAGSDPVNPLNGEMVVESVDLELSGKGEVPFVHRRVYRSRVEYDGPIGFGWDHSQNRRLVPVEGSDWNGDLLLMTGDGRLIRFRLAAKTLRSSGMYGDLYDLAYVAPEGVRDRLIGVRLEVGDEFWVKWFLTSTQALDAVFGDAGLAGAQGLLESQLDAHGYGLTFTWEASPRPEDGFRVREVRDSVARTVRYEYGIDGRLARVIEPETGLEATYEYDANGDLVAATDSRGRTESYEYSSGFPSDVDDYLPESFLRPACELACAPTGSAPGAGGGCDDAPEYGESACVQACWDITTSCDDACRTVCTNGGEGETACDADCSAECTTFCSDDRVNELCQQLYDGGVDDFCNGCEDRIEENCDYPCDNAAMCIIVAGGGNNPYDQPGAADDVVASAAACAAAAGLGEWVGDLMDAVILAGWGLGEALWCAGTYFVCVFGFCDADCNFSNAEEQLKDFCDNSCLQCLADGELQHCAAGGCLAAMTCEEQCRRTFLGQPLTTCQETFPYQSCPAVVRPQCRGNCRTQCEQKCDTNCLLGCTDACVENNNLAECTNGCEGVSDHEWRRRCQPECVDGCVAAERKKGPYVGEKYGRRRDLNHNLLRITDGNGVVYVENAYGERLVEPSFDAVVTQRFGADVVELHYRDLAREAEPVLEPGPSDSSPDEMINPDRPWRHVVDPVAAAWSQSADEFVAVDVCPACVAPPFTSDLDVFIPVGFGLLVVERPAGSTAPAAGLAVEAAPAVDVPVTLLRFDSAGTATPVTAGEPMPLPETAYLADVSTIGLPPTGVGFTLAVAAGTVTFAPDGLGGFRLIGSSTAALAEVRAAGLLVILTDAGGVFRALPGRPKALHHLADGRCTEPFQVAASGARLAFAPADACSDRLWVSPLASMVTDPYEVAALRGDGAAFAASDLFVPTSLVPARYALSLRRVSATGLYARDAGDGSGAAPQTLPWAVRQAAFAGALFLSPTAASAAVAERPATVFHVPADGERERIAIDGLGEARTARAPTGGVWTMGQKTCARADAGTIVSPMTVVSPTGAAGDRWVEAPETARANDQAETGGFARYVIDVAKTNDFAVWAKVLAPDAGRNSFFVEVDGGPAFAWTVPTSASWAWSAVTDPSGAALSLHLLPGRHTVTFRHRESGTKLMAIGVVPITVDGGAVCEAAAIPQTDGPPDGPPGIGDFAGFDRPDRFVLPPAPACTGGFRVPRRSDGRFAGTKPSRATVLRDPHGVYHAYYGDADSRLLRTVNHGTGQAGDPVRTESYSYDRTGQLTGTEHPLGDRTCVAYDGYGDPTRIVDFPVPGAPGDTTPRVQKLAYDLREPYESPIRLRSVYSVDYPGHELVRYVWDGDGGLVKVYGAGDETTLVTPTPWGSPAVVVHPDGTEDHTTYDDATGRAALTVLGANRSAPETVVSQFDRAGRPIRTTLPTGAVLTWEWLAGLLASRRLDGDGFSRTEHFEYDGDAQLVTLSGDTSRTTFAYDERGPARLRRDVDLTGAAPDAVVCRRHGAAGRLLEEVLPDGTRRRFQHDGAGNVVAVEAGVLASSPEAWDDDCPAPGAAPGGAHLLAAAQYDAGGRAIAVTDAGGATTTYTYDGFGRPIVVTDAAGTSTRTGYLKSGRIAWRAVYAASGASTPYGPPARGELGLLAAEEVEYDADGRTVARRVWHFDEDGDVGDGVAQTTWAYEVGPDLRAVTITDDAGNVTRYATTDGGRLSAVELPGGDAITRELLDGGRRLVSSWPTPGGSVEQTVYRDELGQTIRVDAAAAGESVTVSAWSRDLLGRPTDLVTSDGLALAVAYDGFGRPIEEIRSFGTTQETVALTRDAAGRLIRRESHAGATKHTEYGYDELGRLVRLERPEGFVERTTYLGATERPATFIDPRGIERSFTWSPRGDLLEVRAGGESRQFAYDALGRLVEATTDSGVAVSVGWDSMDNRTRESSTLFPEGVAHAYDGVGRPVTSLIGGETVLRGYDPLGRLATLDLAAEPLATFTWGGLGGPLALDRGSGVSTLYSYDPLGRLAGQEDWRDSTRLARWRWETPWGSEAPRLAGLTRAGGEFASVFDVGPGDRILGEAHILPGLSTVTFGVGTSPAEADAAVAPYHRTGNRWRAYQLDGRHNWLSREGSQAAANVATTRNALDAYTSFGAITMQVDLAGATTRLGGMTLSYDGFGRLASIQRAAGTITYRRDAFGRVVEETDSATGQTVAWGWDGERRTLRRTAAGVDVTLQGDGLDEHVVTLLPDGGRRYYHLDRRGSVYLVSDAAGLPLEWIEYLAFGEPRYRDAAAALVAAPPIDNPFGFQGHPTNALTGFVDMRARVYDPKRGRFLSADPIGDAGGANLYAFVDGAPLSWSDPTGLAKTRPQFDPSELDIMETLENPDCYDGVCWGDLGAKLAPSERRTTGFATGPAWTDGDTAAGQNLVNVMDFADKAETGWKDIDPMDWRPGRLATAVGVVDTVFTASDFTAAVRDGDTAGAIEAGTDLVADAAVTRGGSSTAGWVSKGLGRVAWVYAWGKVNYDIARYLDEETDGRFGRGVMLMVTDGAWARLELQQQLEMMAARIRGGNRPPPPPPPSCSRFGLPTPEMIRTGCSGKIRR